MVIFYSLFFFFFLRANHITQDGSWGGMNLQSRQNHCKPTKMCVSAIKTEPLQTNKNVCVCNQDRIIANQQKCVCLQSRQNHCKPTKCVQSKQNHCKPTNCVCIANRIIANQQTVSALQTNKMCVSAIKTESLQTNKLSALQTNRMYVSAIKTESLQTNKICEKLYHY